MQNRIMVVAVFATVPLLVGVVGCGGRHPAENQGIADSAAPVTTEPAPVEATLRPSKTQGRLEIEIKNIGTRPFTFLDIREGCAGCEEFWEVKVQSVSGRTLKPMMFYAPVDLPWKVLIEPGKTYVREIQPSAYVEFYHHKADEEGAIIVHYRVKHPEDWTSVLAAPYPTFSTKPLKGNLADYLLP